MAPPFTNKGRILALEYHSVILWNLRYSPGEPAKNMQKSDILAPFLRYGNMMTLLYVLRDLKLMSECRLHHCCCLFADIIVVVCLQTSLLLFVC